MICLRVCGALSVHVCVFVSLCSCDASISYYGHMILELSTISRRYSTVFVDTSEMVEQRQPFYGSLSATTRVTRYQKKHSPTHHPDHHPVFISFFHLPRSIASSLFKLRAWLSFCTTSFHVLFGLPLGLESSTSYSTHFFTQSVSSFRSTCPYHHNLF